MDSNHPPVFHVTHWKAGSQWIRGVLRELFGDRVVDPLVANEHVTATPIERGRVYPTVYMDRASFERVEVPEDSRVFVVVRDLRDTLISSYYSLAVSHPLLGPGGKPHPGVAEMRERLTSMSVADGLLSLVDDGLKAHAEIQTSWLESEARVLRFEDFVADERGTFEAVLGHCGLDVSREALDGALERWSFERLAGRPRGTEDTASHFRKGISGDWRNHFDDRVRAAFRERFGEHLVRTGYETGLDW